MAVLLGLGDDYGFQKGNKIIPYYKYNWSEYKFSSDFRYGNTRSGKRLGVFLTESELDQANNESLKDEIFKELTGEAPNYVQFYFDPSTSFNESGSNSTSRSMIEGAFDKAEGLLKELAFLGGTANNSILSSASSDIGTRMAQLRSNIKGDNIITRLLSMGSVTLTGANLIFPEVWTDSQFSKSYNIDIKLISPYGTREAIYLNLFVPMAHIIALAFPRQHTPNSFVHPFLIKAFAKGMFNCEMGIVDSITIDKGGSGDAWSADGLPTELRINISVKDLYAAMNITKEQDIRLFFQNQSLMEFLANTCGVNIVKPDLKLKIDLLRSLAFGYVQDIPSRTYENIITGLKETFFSKWIDLTRISR